MGTQCNRPKNSTEVQRKLLHNLMTPSAFFKVSVYFELFYVKSKHKRLPAFCFGSVKPTTCVQGLLVLELEFVFLVNFKVHFYFPKPPAVWLNYNCICLITFVIKTGLVKTCLYVYA